MCFGESSDTGNSDSVKYNCSLVSPISRHLYTDMERVQHVWEVELQAVLEIVKPGHRKRILHSLASTHPVAPSNATQLQAPASQHNNGSPAKPSTTMLAVAAAKAHATHAATTAGILKPANGGTVPRTNHGKNRMAPQPPGKVAAAIVNNLEIRTPAELLLGTPAGLQTTWRHMPADLLAGRIQYEVNVSIVRSRDVVWTI